jgi:hypothetical protein
MNGTHRFLGDLSDLPDEVLSQLIGRFRIKRPWVACADCDLPYSDDGFADFVVNADVWTRITAEDKANILCVCCMTRRAARLGVTAIGRFTSGPFATP